MPHHLKAGLLGLVVIIGSGCSAPTELNAREQIQAQIVLLEVEHRNFQACHKRSMQQIEEFSACMEMPFQSAEADACFAAIKNQNAYVESLDCEKYNAQAGQYAEAYRKAQRVCWDIYPDAASSEREEFRACVASHLSL